MLSSSAPTSDHERTLSYPVTPSPNLFAKTSARSFGSSGVYNQSGCRDKISFMLPTLAAISGTSHAIISLAFWGKQYFPKVFSRLHTIAISSAFINSGTFSNGNSPMSCTRSSKGIGMLRGPAKARCRSRYFALRISNALKRN